MEYLSQQLRILSTQASYMANALEELDLAKRQLAAAQKVIEAVKKHRVGWGCPTPDQGDGGTPICEDCQAIDDALSLFEVLCPPPKCSHPETWFDRTLDEKGNMAQRCIECGEIVE